MIKVCCENCGEEFEKEAKRVNATLKINGHSFCCEECENNYKRTGFNVSCKNCGKEIYVTKTNYINSKTKNFFCNKSCSAKFNNKNRKISEETKNKIRNSLRTKRSIVCKCCKKSFYPYKKEMVYCSKDCSLLDLNGQLPYTKEQAINSFLQLFDLLQRLPTSKEVDKNIQYAFKKFFGGWNKAVESLGFDPNVEWMQKKRCVAKDGHVCDSISEMIVDNYLFENNIKHERRKKYPNSNCDCDFYLIDKDIWVEYFGLAGQNKDYDKKIQEKLKMAKDNKLNLLEIYPYHLYPKNILNDILKF